MKSARLLLAFSVLFFCAGASAQKTGKALHNGDLLFVAAAGSAMDAAISGATGEMVHVAIVSSSPKGLDVIEAAPESGVRVVALEEFVRNQKGASIVAARLKKGTVPVRALRSFVRMAASKAGLPYDWAFAPANDAYYCSELVYDCYVWKGRHLFGQVPMNFCNADGSIDAFWTERFSSMGIPVPQNEAGTNPNGLLRSPLLDIVFEDGITSR